MNRVSRSRKPQPKRAPVALILIVGIVAAALAFVFMPQSGQLPLCPDCAWNSSLREHLEKLGPQWEAPMLTEEQALDELATMEQVVQINRSPSFLSVDRDGECVQKLVERFDFRMHEYAISVVSGLVGYGAIDACPKLEALEKISVRVQSLLNHTTKEAPRCKELLDWHLQQYSCSARQQ